MWVITIISLLKKLFRATQKPSISPSLAPAYLVPDKQHCFSEEHIGRNALKVIQQLNRAGYEAYLVGGGVRDVLLKQRPKDFDVATNASPQQIRQVFRHSRIIGRRFKLVHVWFHREVVEVATFRASEPDHEHHQTNAQGMVTRDNVYGDLVQDAWRRDFTINALYYSVAHQAIIDITGGMTDLNHRVLRMIGEPKVRYQEDPVRILRVIRFAAKLSLTIDPATAAPIAVLKHLLLQVSISRLFDEIVKLYQCGQSQKAHALMIDYGIFSSLCPTIWEHYSTTPNAKKLIDLTLESTDARVRLNKPVTPAFLFAAFLWFPLQVRVEQLRSDQWPLMQTLDQAMSDVIADQGKHLAIPKRLVFMIKDVWSLQYRFQKRTGHRAQHLLTNHRFRAAYDLLALRALAGDAPPELADWWTKFQEVDPIQQTEMVAQLQPTHTDS